MKNKCISRVFCCLLLTSAIILTLILMPVPVLAQSAESYTYDFINIFEHQLTDGTTRHVEVYSYPVLSNADLLLFSVITDITERLIAQNALQTRQHFYYMLSAIVLMIFLAIIIVLMMMIRQRNNAVKEITFWQNMMEYIIRHDSSAIAVHDKNLNYMFVSQRYLDEYQVKDDQIIGKHHYEVFPDLPQKWRDVHQRVLQGSTESNDDDAYIHADGRVDYTRWRAIPWYQQDGAVGGIIIYTEIINEQKKRENERIEQLRHQRQQQKLESIGTLASGVAHEINNPIMGIINYAQLIFDNETADTENAAYASEIMSESNRISDIVNNLLYFSRQQKQTHSPAVFKEIVTKTLALIRSLLQKDQIIVELQIPADLPFLKCRSQQIQQVVMNMLTNARDALNEKYQGFHDNKKISITAKLFHEENRRWIRLTIEDYGNGIPAEIQERIFDPFYTTKSRDHGTGLGLPISYVIVQEHHGRLRFETKMQTYTRFFLELPVDNGWDLSKQ